RSRFRPVAAATRRVWDTAFSSFGCATISQYFTKPSNDMSPHHRIFMRAELVPGIVSRYWSISSHTSPDVAADNDTVLHVGQLRNATQKMKHLISNACARRGPSF